MTGYCPDCGNTLCICSQVQADMIKKRVCTMCKDTKEDVKIDLDPRNPHEHKPICSDCIEVLRSVDYSLKRINAFIEYQKKWA